MGLNPGYLLESFLLHIFRFGMDQLVKNQTKKIDFYEIGSIWSTCFWVKNISWIYWFDPYSCYHFMTSPFPVRQQVIRFESNLMVRFLLNLLHIIVPTSQQSKDGFQSEDTGGIYFSKIVTPKHYPEQKIWISCLQI